MPKRSSTKLSTVGRKRGDSGRYFQFLYKVSKTEGAKKCSVAASLLHACSSANDMFDVND